MYSCGPTNMFLGDLTPVLEAIDLLVTLKACASLPGFKVVAIRLRIVLMQLKESPGTYALLYVDNSANSLRN